MTRVVENEPSESQPKESEAPTPNPGLRPLDKLVGTWKVSGEARGQLTYEWMDGDFFLIAHGDTEQGGQRTKHTEIIGYDHEAGAAPAASSPPASTRTGATPSATRTRSTNRA